MTGDLYGYPDKSYPVIFAALGGGTPDGSIGKDGQILVSTNNGDKWYKRNGTWILYGDNAYYIQGIPVKQVVPTAQQILAFDAVTAKYLPATLGFPLDVPPANLDSTTSDEFLGTSLDAKWTSPITSATGLGTTTTVSNGWIVVSPSAGGAGSTSHRGGFGIRQASPSGSFTIYAKMIDDAVASTVVSEDMRAGIFVGHSSGNAYVVGSGMGNNRGSNATRVDTYSQTAEWSTGSGLDAFTNDTYTFSNGSHRYRDAYWLKIQWDSGASTLTFSYSPNGLQWTQVATQASETQPDRMGIVLWGNTQNCSGLHFLGCDYFRVSIP